jgi:transposase
LLASDINRHYRIKHESNEFEESQFSQQDENHFKIRNDINGIENFWVLAKIRLARFRGIHKSTLKLHLKECEFRLNDRKENIYKTLLV